MRPILATLLIILLTFTISGCGEKPVTITPSEITLADKENRVLKEFLSLIRNNDLEKAYEYTNDYFKNTVDQEQFELWGQAGKFTEISSAKWTEKVETDTALEVAVDLTLEDKTVQKAKFQMVKDQDEWKIKTLLLETNENAIIDTFPSGKDLESKLQKNFSSLREALENEESSRVFYSNMSQKGQESFTFEDFQKTLEEVQKNQMDIIYTNGDKINIKEEYPKYKNLQIFVDGHYQKEDKLIDFKLVYDFDWDWKINSFTITERVKTNEVSK